MGEREDYPTVDNSDKKRKIPLQTLVTTPEDLKEATEIIVLIEEMLEKRHANLRFEHILLWWFSCEPIEA
tara:strand:+ start:2077 stop:2286 length:210 start_codon:yes stop_codon:yes gene_type:complete